MKNDRLMKRDSNGSISNYLDAAEKTDVKSLKIFLNKKKQNGYPKNAPHQTMFCNARFSAIAQPEEKTQSSQMI